VKVVFHEDFYQVYTSDPAATAGRMEAVVEIIKPVTDFITADPASEADIAAVHKAPHMEQVWPPLPQVAPSRLQLLP